MERQLSNKFAFKRFLFIAKLVVNRFFWRLWLLVLSLGVPTSLFAQKQLVQIHYIDEATSLSQKLQPQIEFADSLLVYQELRLWKEKMILKGYLSASIDSVSWTNEKAEAFVYIGKKYVFERVELLGADNLPLKNQSIKHTETVGDVNRVKERLLKIAENNGYPFASVQIDSFWLNDSKANVLLRISENQYIVYDSLLIYGEKVRFRKKYAQAYLGIKVGKPYKENDVLKLDRRLGDLEYIQQEKNPLIEFSNEIASVNLFLKNRKTSQFELLIGVLPNNENTGKVLVTGQAGIHLVNPFGTGKELLIKWQKLQAKTQRLNTQVVYPYFLNTPLGFDISFDLYKKDTSYLQLDYRIAPQVNFSGTNVFKAFAQFSSTRLLSIDTTAIKLYHKLPTHLDVKSAYYGFDYEFRSLDYRLNPRKGMDLAIKAAVGTRKIEQNNQINNLYDYTRGTSFTYLYDSVQVKSVNYQLAGKLDYFVSIKKRSTFKPGLKAGAFIGKNILENEKFRIGGAKILRGFDEESIITPFYLIAELEYRFLVAKNSFVYAFYDQALVQNNLNQLDYPLGFGLGAAIDTRIGIFALSYALGKRNNTNIQLKNSKIHFGYINYF